MLEKSIEGDANVIEITLIRLLAYTVTAMLAIVLIIPVYARGNQPQRYRGGTSEILTTSFSVSRYFDHIEEESLKIREEQEKESDYTIILWWAFDGLKLNKDGSTEWISRRKKLEAHNGTDNTTCGIYNPIYTVLNDYNHMCQAPKATLDAIMEQNTRNSVNTMVAIDSVLAQNMANTIDVQFRQMQQNICQGMQGVCYRSRYPRHPYINMWKL